ncbi:hypothetical protein BCV69DRAFT_204063 [Microstroma glucosiphilum]|uniref:Uncharacterized protein n=1 Tax=Pseudomicrostroma glucosiphilum TaxID=1684307 RepID=A0A316U4R4_9BASI|nr:hypothetical protein BCV69DRAFT_204063 [Pseudomicrostroma glucosiphilum]PWN20242.1 hypothetical protein BCV69DRAFT_204063 [Pseudomicrostroma glucosiphilum]
MATSRRDQAPPPWTTTTPIACLSTVSERADGYHRRRLPLSLSLIGHPPGPHCSLLVSQPTYATRSATPPGAVSSSLCSPTRSRSWELFPSLGTLLCCTPQPYSTLLSLGTPTALKPPSAGVSYPFLLKHGEKHLESTQQRKLISPSQLDRERGKTSADVNWCIHPSFVRTC